MRAQVFDAHADVGFVVLRVGEISPQRYDVFHRHAGRAQQCLQMRPDQVRLLLERRAAQAAILLVQLSRLPEQIETRQRNAVRLIDELSDVDLVSLPFVDPRVSQHSYYLFLLTLNPEKAPGLTKETFVDALVAEGIPCSAGYPYPLYRNIVFEKYDLGKVDCPEAERMCRETFWLSHEVLLASPERVAEAIAAIRKIADSAKSLAASA